MPGVADLRDLAAISSFAADDLLLTQGAGGNTSVKTHPSEGAAGSQLLIKASGLRLADVSETGGYLELDIDKLCAIMDDPTLAELAPILAHERTAQQMRALAEDSRVPGGLRPSMETGFHLLLERVVLHTHPVYLNAFTCSHDGRATLEDAAGFDVAWARYVTPGYPLAEAVAEGCAEYLASHGQQPHRIVLENHGLIAHAAEAQPTIDDTRALTDCGRRVFGALADDVCDLVEPSAVTVGSGERLGRILARLGHPGQVRPARRRAVVAVARGPGLPTRGPLMPDDAVYGVHNFWRLEVGTSGAGKAAEQWAEAQADQLPDKAVLELAGEGTLLIGPNDKTLDFMEENLLANVLVHELIARRGRPRYLEPLQVGEILGLESEQYRQALAGMSPKLKEA